MKRIGILGATGYIGGRLLHRLEEDNLLVCLARNPPHLRSRVSPTTEVRPADVLDPDTLREALKGIHTVYYLVHSMGTSQAFEELDRRAAQNFAEACKRGGVEQIVYLGGLGSGKDLSSHLRSRQEVGEIFRNSGVPTVEFRSSVIIGSGSLSFDLVRTLVEKLPIMVAPKWVRTPTQPISVEDVIDYLVAPLVFDSPRNALYEIGGPDRVTYGDLLREYARQRSLKRWVIPVPILTPKISSLWLGLVTPVFARIGRKLVEGLRNPTTVEDNKALQDFPIRPRSMSEAISRALINEDQEYAETRWMDALSSKGRLRRIDVNRLGPRIVSRLSEKAKCSPSDLFSVVQRIGGEEGWYFANPLWRLRGALDLLIGGVGMRRGRPHPTKLREGDTVDLFRVEACESPSLLRLRAEMKLHGRAWLQFEVSGDDHESEILQTAMFDPLGVLGRFYWYILIPIHWFIFGGMLKAIARRAEQIHRTPL